MMAMSLSKKITNDGGRAKLPRGTIQYQIFVLYFMKICPIHVKLFKRGGLTDQPTDRFILERLERK